MVNSKYNECNNPENGNKIDYVLPVPPASGYRVSYQVSTDLILYLPAIMAVKERLRLKRSIKT